MWRKKITDLMADVLRFTVRAAILIDGIAISVTSVYIIIRLCIHTAQYLDKVWFAEPW